MPDLYAIGLPPLPHGAPQIMTGLAHHVACVTERLACITQGLARLGGFHHFAVGIEAEMRTKHFGGRLVRGVRRRKLRFECR